MYRSFVSLGRYTSKYFILFVAMMNGIVSLISLSVFSLLVYRNARDFHIKVFEDCLAQRKQENAIKGRPCYGISPTTSLAM